MTEDGPQTQHTPPQTQQPTQSVPQPSTPAPSKPKAELPELMETIGKKRGFLISGGEINIERTANMLLDEFRSAKIGRVTLDAAHRKD